MIDQGVSKIRDFIARPGVTKSLVATAAGINRNTLDGIEDDDWDPRLSTLRKLEGAVDRLSHAIQ